ncbi:uncharacterized protein LOC142993950 [Genypterus blacodes]|uniref:uncharacterized protein LOC142993950 n=1 Tax=Genypterus blacodes TaxID=154954 RepID=UPI003F76D14B
MPGWNPPEQTASQGLNIMLVGPRRTGKSSTGNTLLGRGPVFETRGGGASTVASTSAAGRHMTVVDAQGWSSSEASVPRQEKIELLRALDLFGSGGPHVILLVIPLLDFTEPERQAVEKRMEVLNSTVWRHTMVLFTFGDLLRKSGRSVQQHIQSGGPALQWLMEKCRYRYHVLDNKTVTTTKQEEQVKELLGKVEDMLQENGGWHFSLHMYLRLEEEWCRREKELRARLEQERDEERVSSQEKRGRENVEWRNIDGEINTEEDEESRDKVELGRQSSEEEEGWDTLMREEGRRVKVEGERNHSTDVKSGLLSPYRGVKG